MANNLILGSMPNKLGKHIINYVQRRNMPVNVPPTATGKRRFRLPVETDPRKLVNFCCGLNFHNDEPPIELKPEAEYPEWLWGLRLKEKPHSWEMEPGTKEYYLRVKEEEYDANYIKRLRQRRPKKVVGEVEKARMDYLKHIRFAALSHMEEDAGLAIDEIQDDWCRKLYKSNRLREYYLPVEENRVLYTDQLMGNAKRKNFNIDHESTFERKIVVKPRAPLKTPAILDSKRRHRYAAN